MSCPAESLFGSLWRVSGERTRRSLKIIHDLCLSERTRKIPELTVAHIGRLSSKNGGPSIATLRNRPNDYCALIRAHASAVKRPTPPAREDDFFKSIPNPEIRARCGAMVAELRALRSQLRSARHVAHQTAIVHLDDKPKPSASTATPTLTATERRALTGALSKEALDHFGWAEDELGRIVDEQGLVVFQAGFATALRKVLDASQ